MAAMSAAVAVAVASASGAPSPYSFLNSWNSAATSPTITSNTLAKGLVAYAEEEEEERDTASDVGKSNPKRPLLVIMITSSFHRTL